MKSEPWIWWYSGLNRFVPPHSVHAEYAFIISSARTGVAGSTSAQRSTQAHTGGSGVDRDEAQCNTHGRGRPSGRSECSKSSCYPISMNVSKYRFWFWIMTFRILLWYWNISKWGYFSFFFGIYEYNKFFFFRFWSCLCGQVDCRDRGQSQRRVWVWDMDDTECLM